MTNLVDNVSRAIELKMELQSYGVRAPARVFARSGGAGPSDGIMVFIDELVATVPTRAWYTERSPYSMSETDGGRWELKKSGEPIAEVGVAEEPEFYDLVMEGTVPYRKIALRHGRDGIGSTVAQGCSHGKDACRFCAITITKDDGSTLARKSPGDLAEVAAAAEAEGYSHVVLTTGSTGDDAGILHMANCAEAVRENTGMKVHVQFEPPSDLGLIDLAAEVSDSAAVNIECFDASLRAEVTPGKAKVGMEGYVEAWSRAVGAFGEGQVTSFVILGLGEPDESVLEGCRLLASIGVYPFLLPLRPIAGTPLEHMTPPAPDELSRIYEKAADIVNAAGLSASRCLAGCVRCGACTAFTDVSG